MSLNISTARPLTTLIGIPSAMLRELVEGYGAFLFFHRLAPNLLLVGATLTEPRVGLLGLASGASTLVARRVLGLRPIAGGMDGFNGMLAGLFLGSVFAPGWKVTLLAVMAGPLTVLVASWLSETLARRQLPLLSGAFVGVGVMLFAVGRAIALPFAPYEAPVPTPWMAQWGLDFFTMLGAIYLSPTVTGGVLVLAAIAISSRSLVLLSALAFVIARVILWAMGVPPSGLAGISVTTAAALVSIMTGGIFARPGPRVFAVAAFGTVLVCLFSVAWQNMMWFVGLPPLSVPYLVTTWLIMMALKGEHGGAWASYWLPVPALPEQSLEQQRQADARGLETGSVALRMPLLGRWTVYQGFDGPHTHVPPRQHAFDFHLLEEGRAFRGEGVLLEDYYAFDQPVLSPVYGCVAACRSDLPDNLPGEVDVLECWGNYVLIALASGDYVLLAHLRQASVCVAIGTALVPGQEVGRCGNSGRSPTPHLHIHVQTTAVLGGPTRPFHLSGIVNAAAGADDHEFSLSAVPAAGDGVWSPPANAALARALHWPVGRRLVYAASLDGGPSHATEIEVTLDSNGMFRLRGANDASIAFVETADLVALYDRAGGNDPVLDCFALALGVTPLANGTLNWSDVPPLRLLPAPFPVKVLCWLIPALGVTESRYERHWDANALLWRQTGRHRLRFAGYGLWSCRTEASITANVGITAITLSVDRKNANIVDAKLNGVGVRGDRGIPEWLSRW